MSEALAEEIFRKAADTLEVSPPSYDEVVARSLEQRRRRRRTVAASVAAVLVIAGLGGWAATRGTPDPAPQSERVVRSPNPVDVAWYADGRLHLSAVAVDLPGLADLASVGDSVVYLDEDGVVGVVDGAGAVAEVGTSARSSRVVGSVENLWAAWIESDDRGDRVVLWAAALGEELGSVPVDTSAELVAIDQDRVQFTTDSGDFTWSPADPRPERHEERGVVDVASATRVYQRGDRIEIVQPFFSVSYLRRGVGASISPGGLYVLTQERADRADGGYRPLIYNARSGEPVPSGIARGERVVDAAFVNNYQISYLVGQEGEAAGLLLLRRCDLESATCRDLVPVRTGGPAMFAD